MIKKLFAYTLIIMGLSSCVHGQDRQSTWAELDGISDMECDHLQLFEEAKSIRLKSVRFFVVEKKIFVLVSHVTRSGLLESKIGMFSDPGSAPKWLYTSNGPSLGFITDTEFIEADLSGVSLVVNGKKSEQLTKAFEIVPEILSISSNRFAVLDGREAIIFQRSGSQSFKEEKRIAEVKSWTNDLNVATFMATEQDGLTAYLVTENGVVSRKVENEDFGIIQDKSEVVTFKISTGETMERPSIVLKGTEKSWKYGYLRTHSTDTKIFIQRWIDGESIVEWLNPSNSQWSMLGVLPPNWWIRNIANQSSASPEILVEGNHEWYLCSKGE